ncbi:MAG: Hint domain-containing protein [Gemmobacter sp.]
MADYAATMRVYNGSVSEAQLLSTQQTLVLNSFGSSQSTTISDADGALYVGNTTVIGGTSSQMLGSGWVQPGASILGTIVPLGSPKDAIMLRNLTTGKITFVFPDGAPNVLGAVLMVVDIDPVGYNLATKGPACFVEGTRLLTPDGYRAVEDLRAGDRVTRRDGRSVPLLQAVAQHFVLSARSRAGLEPVIVEPGAFGAGTPLRRLALLPQHRVVVRGPKVELWLGMDETEVPVQALIDGVRIYRAERWEQVAYRQLVFVNEVVLVAEGVPVEGFFWVRKRWSGMTSSSGVRQTPCFPSCVAGFRPRRACAACDLAQVG